MQLKAHEAFAALGAPEEPAELKPPDTPTAPEALEESSHAAC
jgi:hypothetical protein